LVSALLQTPRSIAVIGAGPAGLMAADVIASAGHAVTIYERMPSPARKFLMAGRGGLNLTHSEPLERFLTRFGSEAENIRKAIEKFPPERVIAWAEGLGQETFKGSSGRIFPKAMKASPLLRAWLKRLAAFGVELKTGHTWTGFSGENAICVTPPDGGTLILEPDAVILALGGASWPRLGSDGAWVSSLENAGIRIAPLEAANSGVLITWSDVFSKRFAGAPLKRIAVSAGAQSQRGEAVVTRNGLEGGVIYALGRDIREAIHANGMCELIIDLKPDLTTADLTARLVRPQGSQSRSNFLRKATGLDAVAIGLLREAGPLPETADAMAARIKALPLTVHGVAGLERAISTAGGVLSSGLTDGFMLSARPGVFAAGEMLDWDAPTGGYLLQASLATGYAAGQGALAWVSSADQPKRA
jgi:uncharacterized flavoprotein (TIGR03862 family)